MRPTTLLPAVLLAAASLAAPAATAQHDILCIETRNTLGFPDGCVYTDHVMDATVKLVDWQPAPVCDPFQPCPMYARALVHDQAHVDLTVLGAWHTLPGTNPCDNTRVCYCFDCIAWDQVCTLGCEPCALCNICVEGLDGGCQGIPPVGPLPPVPGLPHYVATGVALADIDQDGGWDAVGILVQDTWYVVPTPCDARFHGELVCAVPLP